ncbi:MAG: hypothetical protein JSW33_02005 [bacterium]|nr:MAG: hypothetical protein JSW33_02005 [bacterium]
MKKYFIIILHAFFVMISCDQGEVNKVDPPPAVKIVQKNSDTSVVEKGIDALYDVSSPDNNYISMEWYRNPENRLAGYEIYRSIEANRNFQAIARVTTKNRLGIDTVFIDKTVSLNQRYYYFIRAFDDLDQYGDPSDTSEYELIEIPVLSYPVYNIGNITSPIFKWSFANSINPHFFVFRLEKSQNEVYVNIHTKLCERITDYKTDQEWDLQKLQYASTLTAGTYRWRIDSIGSERDRIGSESMWFIFVIE